MLDRALTQLARNPARRLLQRLLDQRTAFAYQFEGMSAIEFNYDNYEATRLQLIETVKTSLDESDRAFLLSLNGLEPDWSIYDFQEFPSIKWKLLNLEKFGQDKPEIYQQQIDALKGVLEQ